MVYSNNFHRLVLGGTLYTERWNTSLSIIGDLLPPVTETHLNAIGTVISNWFVGSGGANNPNFSSLVKLTDIKLNRIDVDGTYQDPVSQTLVYPTPFAGGFSGANMPSQLACVVTLRTAVDRGRANRGRMFLPPVSGFFTPGTDGRALATDAARVSNSIATLFNSIRAAYIASYGAGDFRGNVGVTSNIGAGEERVVTRVETGRVIDTMRSRRTSLVEDRQPNTVPLAPAV